MKENSGPKQSLKTLLFILQTLELTSLANYPSVGCSTALQPLFSHLPTGLVGGESTMGTNPFNQGCVTSEELNTLCSGDICLLFTYKREDQNYTAKITEQQQ